MRSNELINPRPKIMLNINPELLDELLKEYTNPQDLMGENGILKQLTKALAKSPGTGIGDWFRRIGS